MVLIVVLSVIQVICWSLVIYFNYKSMKHLDNAIRITKEFNDFVARRMR